jgi:hypothetical protein
VSTLQDHCDDKRLYSHVKCPKLWQALGGGLGTGYVWGIMGLYLEGPPLRLEAFSKGLCGPG